MNPAQNQRYFKIGEAAKLLGLSSETLRRWEKAGKISFLRTPGGKRLFSEADLASIRHLLEPTHEPIQTSTYQSPISSATHSERITLSISIPKFSFPKFNFNYKKVSIALVILALVGGNIFFFSKTPYSQQAVLGAETFIAPALEEGGPVSSLFLQAGKTFSTLGSLFRNNPVASFVIPLVQNIEDKSTSGNLNVKGKAFITKDIEGLGNLKIKGTATVGKLVTGIVDPYLIENDGTVQSTLEIRSVGDISLQPQGNVNIQGGLSSNNLTVNNNSTVGGNETIGGNLTVTGTFSIPKITTTSDATIGGNITLSGVINSNTLTDTKLVFAGSSPSIYAGTTNTGISLNANGTGAISIGNSSTGDIYIGGGTSSTVYCLISNSTANLNCNGDITAGGNLTANGGYLKTSSTTGYLFNTTATTLNIGGAATTLSIGASTGTTTINNAETVTGNFSQSGSSTFSTGTGVVSLNGAVTASSTLGVTGTTSLNGAVNLGDATSDDIAVNGRLTTSVLPKTTGSVDLGSAALKFNNLYSNTINTAAINTSGQGVFNLNPASVAITDASLLINPTTVTNAGSALLGIAVAGVEKARIDETGKLTLTGGLTVVGALSGITTINMSGQLTSTLVTGTAPFVVASTTNVANLNASSLNGATFAAPGAIGGGTAAAGTFTTVSAGTSIATTSTGTITSAGLLTASNGLTLTTGALNLTGTSGSIGLTGFGTTAITSTTTSGDVIAATDTSLNTASANLTNFTFKNNNTAGAGLAVNGVTITEQAAAAPLSGTNTSNLINLSAAANGTVNGINISSATGFTNFFKTPTFNLDSSGNITGVVGLTATNLTGAIQTASQTNITTVGTLGSLAVTGNVNSVSGSLQTNTVTRIDNSGNLTAGTGSFAGTITPSADASYDIGSSSLRWTNAFFSGDVNVGDTVFKNKFRLTEHGATGIDMLNPKGEVIASWDENGNFWVKGEIKHGTGN